MKTGYYKFDVNLTTWVVPERYTNFDAIGVGAFGMVCSALDTQTGQNVAIKKLHRPFKSTEHAKRAFRELTLLRRMDHEHVIKLINVFTPDQASKDLNDLYLVTPLMDSDLHSILRHQHLSHLQAQTLAYQLIRGLKYIHSAGIIHRDLKPANLGILAAECELRILDFGLARVTADAMTGYVTTRWYRAPEIIFNWTKYDQTADMWSVGCIMAEMITGKPLFPGQDQFGQLKCIMKLVGSPSESFLAKLTSEEARNYIRDKFPATQKRDFAKVFPTASPETRDLLEKMLVLDPECRITASEALEHSYFGELHDPNDEPTTAPMVDLAFEGFNLTIPQWRNMIWSEIGQQDAIVS